MSQKLQCATILTFQSLKTSKGCRWIWQPFKNDLPVLMDSKRIEWGNIKSGGSYAPAYKYNLCLDTIIILSHNVLHLHALRKSRYHRL